MAVLQDKHPGAGAGAGPDAGADAAVDTRAGAGEGPGLDAPHGLPLDRPDLPQDRGAGKGLPLIQQQVPQPIVDRPMVLNEGNKAAVQADEFGAQRRHVKGDQQRIDHIIRLNRRRFLNRMQISYDAVKNKE